MEDYSNLKVVELKDLLKERGIPSTGLSRKQQIIEALEAHDAEQGESGQKEQLAEQAGSENEDAGGDGKSALEVSDVNSTVQDQDKDQEMAENTHTGAMDTAAIAEPPPEKHIINAMDQSPSSESISSEAKKRKRRSPTPTLSPSNVAKKLKTGASDAVVLPEDMATGEAADPGIADSGTSGGSNARQKNTAAEPELAQVRNRTVQPAVHPATEALYISNLVRPLQRQELRDHIALLAAPGASGVDDSVIEVFHLDILRSHALVILKSISAASRVRSLLHDQIWSEEQSRKPLWVDFVPTDKVRTWIDTELNSNSKGREPKRWEVIYAEDEDGVIATHQEATSTSRAEDTSPQPSMHQHEVGPGMPNAPTGPRGGQRAAAPHREERQEAYVPPASQPTPANSGSFDVLDERFKFTNTKPKLYYLPVSDELVGKRLDELDSLTSRDWDPKRDGSFTFHNSDLRRYTFEDGRRLVDGGPDIGNFGKPSTGARRGRGRGRF